MSIININPVALRFQVQEKINIFGYKNYDFKNIKIDELNKIRNVNEYMHSVIEFIKINYIKKLNNINNLKWKFKCFDETIELHKTIQEILLLLFNLKKDLILLFPEYKEMINDIKKINIKKSIIIEIYNNEILLTLQIINFDWII